MMHARSRYVLLGCLLLLPTLSFAKSSSPEPVGHMAASATNVQWSTGGVDYERISLTVVGPNGAVYHKEFAAGTAPTFRPQDLGGRLTDGSYTYELRVIPRISDEVKKQLANARAANDDAAAARIQLAAGIGANPVVQSGSLLVANGAFVSSDGQEPSAKQPVSGGPTASSISAPKIKPLDVVTADDAIIQGSLCVGLDCVNNESFGFDTIRLKENNTRIKFEDTSTSSGFPTHDWQLTANDSAPGGAEKFSIEDITAATVPFTVTGSAPTNSIFVDSTGRLGLRTATPVLDVHVNTSNTPAMRLEQNNSGGFTAQTWDVGGNEANFFVRDVTGGSRLPFRIRPGAPTSSIDISASGNVGIGTASPSNKVDVQGSVGGGASVRISSKNTSNAGYGDIFAFNDGSSYAGFQVLGSAVASTTYGVSNANLVKLVGSGSTVAVGNDANNPLIFETNQIERARIDTAGNVGIGVTSPSSKLHVAGDVRVTGGSFIDDGVTVIAPDYVFDSTYQLMPLDKLSNFIRAEKHLPNVPSASDVKANGVNLSQFQMRLLEKVEELTLYTLSQNEQLGNLKTENKQLTDRLAAIEKQISGQKQ